MQVIHFSLVSIFLSCARNIDAAVATLQSPSVLRMATTAPSKNRNNKQVGYIIPNNNEFGSNFNNGGVAFKQNNDFQSARLSMVNNNVSYKLSPIVNQGERYYFTEIIRKDNPGNVGTPSFKMYNELTSVFNSIIHTWLSRDGEYKYEVPKYIVEVVDEAMTQLMAAQRNEEIEIYNLTSVYYYMFNINQTRDTSNRGEIYNIGISLKKILKYTTGNSTQNSNGDDLYDLTNGVENIKEILKLFKNSKVNQSDILINVDLMKGRMMLNETNNEHLNKIKKGLTPEYIQEIIDQQSEIDGTAIDKNHVKLLCTIMPDVYGLLYNHNRLLKLVNNHIINENEEQFLADSSRFFNKFLNIFINRYSNFVGKDQNQTVDVKSIKKLLKVLDPNSDENSEKLKSNSTKPKLDIKKILDLEEMAIEDVLNLAAKFITKPVIKNTISEADYEKSQEKEYCFKKIYDNAVLAYSFLGAFERKFLEGIKKIHNIPNEILDNILLF